MFPILVRFTIFNREIIIGSYGFMVVISLLLGSLYILFLAKKLKYNTNNILSYILIIISFGFVFSFLSGLVLYSKSIIVLNDYYQIPLLSWGAVFGGLVAIFCFKLFWNVEIFHLIDLLTPGYTLSLGLGRLGCFLGGCCYGIHTDSAIGIHFTDPIAPASYSIQPLVPVQIISFLFLLLLTLILTLSLFKKFEVVGFTSVIFFLSYSSFRFIIEFLRNDTRLFFLGFSDGQLYSVFMFIFGCSILIYRKILSS